MEIKVEDDTIKYEGINSEQKRGKKKYKKRKQTEPPLIGIKNIAKNYAKAICSFACSGIGRPYMDELYQSEGCGEIEFRKWIDRYKEGIYGIQEFKWLLLQYEEDSARVRAFKSVYQKIAIIFMKYFCVNWIFHSRVKNRLAHLTYRFRILRRIRNPEHFTYLRSPMKGISKLHT